MVGVRTEFEFIFLFNALGLGCGRFVLLQLVNRFAVVFEESPDVVVQCLHLVKLFFLRKMEAAHPLEVHDHDKFGLRTHSEIIEALVF